MACDVLFPLMWATAACRPESAQPAVLPTVSPSPTLTALPASPEVATPPDASPEPRSRTDGACPSGEPGPCSADCWCAYPQSAAVDYTMLAGTDSDLWLAGGSVVSHWDGGQWRATPDLVAGVPRPARVNFHGLWTSGATDVWAVGGADDAVIDTQDGPNIVIPGSCRLAHWNGRSWKAYRCPGTTAPLRSVWGRASNDVWALGDLELLHWNGRLWTSVPVGLGADYGRTLSGAGSAEPSILVHKGGWVLRQHGRELAVPARPDRALNALWVYGQDAWIVGEDGVIVHCTADGCALVPSGTDKRLYAVAGSRPDDVFAVGVEGTIVHWDGNRWTTNASGTTQHLQAVWVGMREAWAAGVAGTVLRHRARSP